MAKTKVHGEYLDPSVISGQTQVTAVGADSVLILDATDNALKKALLSDVIETIDGGAPTFTTATISGSNPVLNIARTSNYTYKIGSLANDTFAIQSNETSDASYASLIEIDSYAHQGSGPAIKVDSSGNVGIGGSPGAKLDVNTGTVNTLAHFHSTDDNAFIELKDDDTTGYIGVQNDYVYVGGAPSTNSQNIVIHKTTGNVGIRWTAPTARLGILQNGSTTPGMNITDGATADFRVFAGYVSGVTRIGTSAGHLAIDTGGTERARLKSNGNFGLGTTDPDENLTIASAAPTIKFVDTDGTEQNTIVKQSGGNFFIIARNGNDNAGIAFMGNGGGTTDEYARFLANGNLGLDDTSPMSKIQVGTPNSMTASHYGRAEYAGLNLTIPNSVGAANQIIFSNAAAESYGYGGLGMVMTSGSGVGLADMVTTIKTTGSNAVAIERLRIFAEDRPKYSFGTTGTGVNDGPAIFAASTSPSNNTHLWFHFLEANNHGSAAGIKVGGLLASSTYALASPSRGNIYAQGNVSAATFTDRTPYPTSLQLAKDVINSHQRRSEEEITKLATEQYNKIQEESDMPQPERESLSLEEFLDKHKKEYELDHSVLHDYVNDTEYAENGIEGRDASATISCLVEVVKDLMQRLETLENG